MARRAPARPATRSGWARLARHGVGRVPSSTELTRMTGSGERPAAWGAQGASPGGPVHTSPMATRPAGRQQGSGRPGLRRGPEPLGVSGPRPGRAKLRLEVRAWSGARGWEVTLCPGHVAERRLRCDDPGSPRTPTLPWAQATHSLHPAGSPRAGGRQASLLPAGEPGPGAPCTVPAPGPRPAVPSRCRRGGPAELSPLPPASLGRTRRCSEPPQPRRRTHALGRVLGLCLPQDPPSLHAGDCRVPSPGAERTAPLPELALPGRGDFPWEGLCH